ncbi:MAG: site-specific integrase [Alphaproteobacteria bacterium]
MQTYRPAPEAVRLWKRKNGQWYFCYEDNTGRTRQRSVGTQDEAIAKLELARYREELRQAPLRDRRIVSIVDAYLQDRKNVRSIDTLHFTCKPLREHLGGLAGDELDDLMIAEYISVRRDLGRADGTIAKELRILRAALNLAERRGIIERAPKYRIELKASRAREYWITRDQARLLVAHCEAYHIKLFCELALGTAARKSAILELTWDRVNFETGMISFGAGHGNKRRSTVPMNTRLREVLDGAWMIATSDFVIEWNSKPVKDIKTGFKAAVKRAGLPAHVTPHVLRHTVATWMAMDDVPLRKIAKYLGDTEEVVERVYAKHSPSYLASAADSAIF